MQHLFIYIHACVHLRPPPRIMQPSRPSSDKGNLINPFIVVTKCYYEGLISYYITNPPCQIHPEDAL
jgi:hypothetical protein